MTKTESLSHINLGGVLLAPDMSPLNVRHCNYEYYVISSQAITVGRCHGERPSVSHV